MATFPLGWCRSGLGDALKRVETTFFMGFKNAIRLTGIVWGEKWHGLYGGFLLSYMCKAMHNPLVHGLCMAVHGTINALLTMWSVN